MLPWAKKLNKPKTSPIKWSWYRIAMALLLCTVYVAIGGLAAFYLTAERTQAGVVGFLAEQLLAKLQEDSE